MIHLIEVKNPFQPVASRVHHEVDYCEGMTIADAMLAAGVAMVRHAAVIDGMAYPEAVLAGVSIGDEMTVIVMPSVAGGGFGRMFAELAVIVAAIVVTGGLAAGPLAALGGGPLGSFFAGIGLGNLSAGAVGAIGAGIALGGNMLVNAFLHPSMGSGNDSASFDPTGPKTVASGGTPIPKGYGKVRGGGSIIASYVAAEGKDNYLNVLLSYGWGPARAINDIRINNNDISNYKNVLYQTRLGTNTQEPIPYFNNIVNGYPQAVRCNAGEAVVIQGTGTTTQELQVVVQFPNGVFWSEDNGSLRSLSIAYKVEYAPSGTSSWQTILRPRTTSDIPRFNNNGTLTFPGWVVVPSDTHYSSGIVYAYDNDLSPTAHTPGDTWTGTSTVTVYDATGASSTKTVTLTGEWQLCDPNLNQQLVTDWYDGYEIFTDANQGALYHTTRIPALSPGKYDVRITKYGSAFAGDPIQFLEANNNRTGDQIWVHSINEVQYQDLAYPNMILVGVRALATDQLSGGNLNVTAEVDYGLGTNLPEELVGFGEDNPACVLYDMFVNDLYGGAVDATWWDLRMLAALAERSDTTVSDGKGGTQKRCVFNGIFDQTGTNLWRQAQKVAQLANAAILRIGRNFTIMFDEPVEVPVQVFTSGNILRDSLKDTWLSLDDRANKIEITFPDADRDYRTDEPCSVMLPSAISAGVEVKTTRMQLLGCTNRAQAWHWGYKKLLSTSLLMLTRSIDVGIEAVACQVGSVIGIQDDIAQWANGGRIQEGSTADSLLVDVDDLQFAVGDGWTVSVVHPVVERGTATIQSIAGKVLTLTANLPSGRILLAVNASGKEAIVQGFSSNTLLLDDVSGFTSGAVITLYDEDVIDTQPVASLEGKNITPFAPFIQTPTADCPWVYGQSGGAFPAKLFTVTNIRKKNDFQVTIDTLIYDPATEADDTPIITETLAVPSKSAAVSSLTADERYVLANGANGGQSSLIVVGWQNGPNTVETQIWVARNETNQPLSAEVLYATVPKGQTYSFPASTGSILQIRAVGVDGTGVTAPFSTAPVVTLTVQGSGLAPADVANFTGSSSTGGNALTWSAAAGAASYEIRYNADPGNLNWPSATLLWSGTGTAWTDSTLRTGVYLVKALSSTSVESVHAGTWNYLQSPTRVNVVGLAPGQTVSLSITENSYDATSGKCTLRIEVPAQSLYLSDGTVASIPASGIEWVKELDPATAYYLYPYLAPFTFLLGIATGGNLLPDTSANSIDLVTSYSNGNYACGAMTVTTPSSGGSGGTGTGGLTMTGGGPKGGGTIYVQESPGP